MDILDSIKSTIGGSDSKEGNILSSITSMIGGEGLNGIISKFNANGLGNLVSSWIGKGENLPVSQDQIKNVIGNEKINEIAQKMGVEPAEAAGKLSDMLPKVIDKLTPDGKVPEGDILSKGMDMLGGFFGNKK
ncbi:MAG TPA: YidB family protein [Ignavibacteriaceae bacterium]|nr:YidB family protein [Ignavibacteriaceae bacterium]